MLPVDCHACGSSIGDRRIVGVYAFPCTEDVGVQRVYRITG